MRRVWSVGVLSHLSLHCQHYLVNKGTDTCKCTGIINQGGISGEGMDSHCVHAD